MGQRLQGHFNVITVQRWVVVLVLNIIVGR
jgi:hypothetical protein